jgi:hypothetical protein
MIHMYGGHQDQVLLAGSSAELSVHAGSLCPQHCKHEYILERTLVQPVPT